MNALYKLATSQSSGDYGQDALEVVDQALDVVGSAELYNVKLDILKKYDPTKVISVCNAALSDAGLVKSEKVFFAENKVKFGEALGLSIKEQKEAKKELDDVKNEKETEYLVKGLKKFSCDDCNRKFARNDTLLKHKIIMHSGSKICARCKIEFVDKAAFNIHQISCLPRCHVCDKTFQTNRNKINHMKNH